MSTMFAGQMAGLTAEQRLHFYEVFAHNLTVAVRGVWSDESLSPTEKIERMKWVNELLHLTTAKVWVLRLKTHDWTEEDFGAVIVETVVNHPGIGAEVAAALRRSFEAVGAAL